MAIEQPVAGTVLSTGKHTDMHRIIACDASAPVKSIAVNSDGTVDIIQLAAGGPISADVTTGRLIITNPKYGEMYEYEGSISIVIPVVNIYHAITGGHTGELSGFTFLQGVTGSIASVQEDVPGVSYQVNTSAAHNLSTGDIVTQHGTTDYNGTKTVLSTPDSDSYIVAGTYGVTRTGTFARGDRLKASSGSAGKYLCSMALVADAAGNGKTFKFEMNKNALPQDNIVSESLFPTGTSYVPLFSSGIITVADGDMIWMSVKNKTDGTNITIRHYNVNMARIA